MNSATNRDASAHCFWRGRGAPGCWMVLLGLFILGTGKGLAEEGNRLDWWSLKPLVLPQVPVLQKNQRTLRNPIDRFVQARLVEHGLTLSPEADRRTLIRRVYFDLTGLSPSPADVAAFVKDRDSRAYERLVDRLLASPRYGERWARHWLDTVHFAETHGNDQDRPRENAWPYRDYVIHALNDDKPYARFVTEQVAADALYPGEPALIPALGFLASGPWDESSLRDIREDTIDRQIARYLDRDDIVTTVMSTFTSTTVHCARCHDHKFDAISQREYYSLQAVFAGTEKAERYYDLDPKVNARREELMRQQIALDRRDPNVMERMLTPERRAEFAAWEASLSQAPEKWIVLKADSVTAEKGTTFAAQPDGSMLATGPAPETEVYTFTATTDLTGITAARLEVLPDDSLPKHGPGRQPDNGNLHLSE
ncbi:MAG TPA: DUF1549 domain-containing protein, partial [Verrucomicrobiae bacterium]|nr:DUF1549 domain-containing protein [Verrucomicrobiae bacterium]